MNPTATVAPEELVELTGDATVPELLGAVEEVAALETVVAVRKLQLAVEWVLAHPGEEVDTSIEFGMRDLQIAGEGAPTIDEGAVAEFAHAIGVSTDAGRIYLGEAVELAYRLRRIWARVVCGEVTVWKARKVAQATMSLPRAAADAVDRAIYFVLKRCSFAEIDRQVERARAAHDPAETERRRLAALERRHVRVGLDQATADGLVPIDGWMEHADALALETALQTIATTLDPSLSLEARRAVALGILADHTNGSASGSAREVVLHLHVRPDQRLVEVEETRSSVTVDHVREWCERAGTKVSVKPVIDLGEELSTDAYEPTETMKDQARLRYRECVHPGCHRPARRADVDHIVPWPTGPTASANLAPLCRGHHRLKTHTTWTYTRVPGAGFVWTSPHGRGYVSPDPAPGPGADSEPGRQAS